MQHAAVRGGTGSHRQRWCHQLALLDNPTSLFPQLWCEPGQYSAWGQLFFMPIEASVRALTAVHVPVVAGAINDEAFLFLVDALGLFLAAAFAGLLVTYGIAAPTGDSACAAQPAAKRVQAACRVGAGGGGTDRGAQASHALPGSTVRVP
jgi:hypothetical protein